MKRTFKILLGIGAVAAMVALTVPQAHAQGGVACNPTKRLGAQQQANVAGRITIDTTTNGFPTAPVNDGTLVGSWWSLGTPGNNNGGPHFAGPDLCSCTTGETWCKTGSGAVGANLGLIAQVGRVGCNQTLDCANGQSIVTVVEDTSADGSDAGFIMYIVDDSNATVRAWDHARTADPAPMGLTTHVMERFPTVDVQSSSGPPPNTTLTSDYANVTINFHGVTGGAANTPLSPTSGVIDYSICTAQGTSDPGRDRSLWNCDGADLVPYNDPGPGNDLGGAFLVPCNPPNDPNNTFVAVGINYVDGVDSVYVGASTEVECNPAIADPDERKLRRPDALDSRRRPVSRRGGR